MSKHAFTERQPLYFKGIWFVYLLLLGTLFLFVFGTVQQVILHKQFGDKPAPDWLLITLSILTLVLIASFFVSRLETRITDETISYRWYPFRMKFTTIRWEDVEKADVFDFGFVGAGYRFTPHGTVHTAGSSVGLRLKMRSGKTLILGTREGGALGEFLKQSVTPAG